MSNRVRIVSGIAAVAVIVGTFFVVNGSTDEDKPTETVTVTQTEATGGTTAPQTTASAPDPVQTVAVKDGKPVGGVKTLEFTTGEQIRFNVKSDTADEVHVHGYDIEEPVGPRETANFSFKATIEGILEVELHGSGAEIASLKVSP